VGFDDSSETWARSSTDDPGEKGQGFMRTICSSLCLTIMTTSLTLCGCGGGGASEKEVPKEIMSQPPDMAKMPGFNDMQDKMKNKKGAAKN